MAVNLSHPDFITVVSGLPRSGTSLMMQMLAAGGLPVLTDQLRVPDEDNPKGYLEFEAVKQTKNSAAWVKEAQGKVVKMVHLLLRDLPASGQVYRVLMMRRRITEVMASQRTMLKRQGKSGANLSDEQLGQLFLSQMTQVENWLKTQPHFSLLSVDYNQLIVQPEPQVRLINDFLGGGLNCDAMTGVIDTQLYRQRV